MPCNPIIVSKRPLSIPARVMFSFLAASILGFSCAPRKQADQAPAAAPLSAAVGGTVTFLEGKAFVSNGGKENRLEIGSTVVEADTVRTAKGSSCELSFPGIGRIMIKSDSVVQLARLDLIERRAQVAAKKGGMLAKVQKLAGRDAFTVRTAGVACGVRGTAFSVTVDKTGTNVSVVDGRVALFPDALIESGVYDPVAGEAALGDAAETALEAFPQLEPGQAAYCVAADFTAIGNDVVEGAQEADADIPAILGEAAAATTVERKPVSESDQKAIEEFKARPEPKEPEYLMSASPIIRSTASGGVGTKWPVDQFWDREEVDAASLPALELVPWMYFQDSGGEGAAAQDGPNIKIDVKKPVMDKIWSVQMIMPRVTLVKGRAYRISLVAWADAPHRADAVVAEPELDIDGDGMLYTAMNGYQDFNLGTSPERFIQYFYYHFDTRSGFTPAFHFGTDAGTVWLREFKVEEVALPGAYDETLSDGRVGTGMPFNANFSRGLLGWRGFSFDGSRLGGFTSRDGVMRFEQDAPLEPLWHAQLTSWTGIPLKKGHRYQLEFSMRAEARAGSKSPGFMEFYLCEFDTDVNGDGDKWTMASPWMMASFSPEWTRYRVDFPAYLDLERARLTFGLGGVDRWIELDDIVFRPAE